MNPRHASLHKGRIWRISRDAPLGKFVDPDAKAPLPSEPLERFEPGWRQSSFELAYGLEVREATDTVPGELIDDLFGSPSK